QSSRNTISIPTWKYVQSWMPEHHGGSNRMQPTAVESAAPQKRHRIGGFALVYNEAGHKLGVQKKLAEIA
ncbi:MAG TPA: hypothetical protein VMP12_00870, partial [Candidatus Sulfotelmatobacter sp.]|nr:hypothetical protein [Candidatus Sulfotelmatobacter sp.]